MNEWMRKGLNGPLELPFSGDVGWEVAKAPEPPRKRVTRGLRLASLRAAQPAEADSSAMDGGWEDWGAAVADGDASDGGAAATAGGANGSSYGFERLPGAQAPWQRAEATMRQQKWDGVRSSLHRGYVEQQPAIDALRREAIAAHRQSLQECLAAVQPCCSCCGGTDMQLAGPMEVLYIGIERRFLLSVPVSSCRVEGCGGRFAPSSFSVGCFPATPNASWDVAQTSGMYERRWFDLQLLQLCDSLTFAGRAAAVYSLATVVHKQHELNGCSAPLGWEHMKRQLGEALMVCREGARGARQARQGEPAGLVSYSLSLFTPAALPPHLPAPPCASP